MNAQRMIGESEASETQGKGLLSTCYVYQMCAIPGCILPLKCRYHGVYYCHKHFNRQCMRDKRGKPTDPRYFLGAYGEAAIRKIFTQYGRKVEDQPAKCKFDFLVDGWRVEVKTVNPWKLRSGWLVNFQRNGVLDEQTDFYAVRLESSYEPIHILIPAPIGKKSLHVARGLALWQRRDDFNSFAKGDFGLQPFALASSSASHSFAEKGLR